MGCFLFPFGLIPWFPFKFHAKLPGCTLPKTNSKRTRKWMVGIRLFPIGMAYFQGLKVSFREGNISHQTGFSLKKCLRLKLVLC